MTSILRVLAVATLVATFAVGCGGSDETDSAASDSAAASSTTTTEAPTTTAAPKALTAAEVVEGLRASGLPIGAVTVYDASTDPNEQLGRPGQYTSKATFADTRIGTVVDGVGDGGDIEAFDDQAALMKRADYLSGFADSPPIGGWYQYTAGNVILRVSFTLTPDQAAQYEAALQALFQ
jgi:hypothetical protein